MHGQNHIKFSSVFPKSIRSRKPFKLETFFVDPLTNIQHE